MDGAVNVWIRIICAFTFSFFLFLLLIIFIRLEENCRVFKDSLYVQTGTLSYCVQKQGLQEYNNVQRKDGTYSEYPDELMILVDRYAEFQYVYDNEPEILSQKDYDLFSKLQKQLADYDTNDISFLYGYLNQ